jgi:ABC-type amino acid transport substrate-binding protein
MIKFASSWAGVVAALCLLWPAARAAALDERPEIPLFIAEQTDSQGQPAPGLVTMTGVVKLLAAESGLNLVVHPYPWRRAQMKAKNGEGLLFGAAETAERASIFAFTKPLYSVNQWLVTPAQKPIDFKSWEDLRGKVVSIGSGGKYDAEFEAHRDKTFKVEENAATIASRFKMMDTGRVEVILIDSYRNAAQLETRVNCMYPGTSKWTVSARPVSAEAVLIAVPKSSAWIGYLPVLNEAIDRMSRAHSVQKFLEKRALIESGC